jgi:hypothetical protein
VDVYSRVGFLAGPDAPRWYLYGYNTDEVDVAPYVDAMPLHGKITKVATHNPFVRAPEMVALPCLVSGGVFFRPNTKDPISAAKGLNKRLIHPRPPIDPGLLVRLDAYADRWNKAHLRPLSPDEVPTFDAWLAEVNHPEWRKAEYRKAKEQWDNGEVSERRLREKKCFVKAEFYDDPKYHRIIHSPHDWEKVLQGPFIAALEEQLFARPEFIKKIPRAQWPVYIRDRVGKPGYRCYSSDYSSFEANHVTPLQEATELKMARYVFQNLLHEYGVNDILTSDARKDLQSKLFSAWIKGTRSSGRMSTSVFNGYDNQIFNGFVLEEFCGATDIVCVVEGDDGLFVHNGHRDPEPWMFERLGLTIKIIVVDNWYEASFCGVVTHPDVLNTLASPWKVIFTCSWAGQSYLRAKEATLSKLAQVKGLSYLAQYPGAPVIQSVAIWMLRNSEYDPARLDELLDWYQQQRGITFWDKQVISDIRACQYIRDTNLFAHPISMGSREVVARVFGMDIETQALFESIFDGADSHVALPVELVPVKYRRQWDEFCRFRGKMDTELQVPHHLPVPHNPQAILPIVRQGYHEADLRVRNMLPWPT